MKAYIQLKVEQERAKEKAEEKAKEKKKIKRQKDLNPSRTNREFAINGKGMDSAQIMIMESVLTPTTNPTKGKAKERKDPHQPIPKTTKTTKEKAKENRNRQAKEHPREEIRHQVSRIGQLA